MARTIFIFGLGYVGRPLGHQLATAGWQIRGTTRTPERLAVEAAAGWQIHRFADDQRYGHEHRDVGRRLHESIRLLSVIHVVCSLC